MAKQSFGCGRTGSWQYLRRKEIFPDLGLVFKKNKDLVLFQGIIKGKVSLRLNLPTVDISDEDNCAALGQDEETFRQTLNTS